MNASNKGSGVTRVTLGLRLAEVGRGGREATTADMWLYIGGYMSRERDFSGWDL